MKKILYVFILFPIIIFAQIPTQSENYVRTKVYKIATNTSISDPSPSEALQDVIYFDGFGKPIQQVINQFSASGKNIVIPFEYDALGREIKNYLPYSVDQTDLQYISTANIDVENYPSYQGNNPFYEILYEDSPLNRVLKKSSPGNEWSMGNGHEIKYEYLLNNGSGLNAVKLFVANSTWNNSKEIYDISLVQNNYYGSNTLFREITKNENWTSGVNNTTEKFIDKDGRTVLKRIYNNSQAYDTYYVYDQFGNLTYIIPPKASMMLISPAILDKLCYQYKYDSKNRLVEKKLPGKLWEYIIYDKLDRVVMTGPTRPPFSNLSNNGWAIYKYDSFDRVIITGWMTSSSVINSNVRKLRQDERNIEAINFSEKKLSSGNLTPAGTGNSNNPAYNYTNVTLPTSGYYILSINYYDDYEYIDAPTIPSTVENQSVYYNNTNKPKGLLTGRWIKTIDKSTTTVNKRELFYVLYDYKARPIRTFVRNNETGTGGYTQVDIKFNFSGSVEYMLTSQKRINSEAELKIKDVYTYSDQNRLLSHSQQINSGEIQIIASNTYDELGKLISKGVGNTISNPLQKVDFSYNIKGWLTGINDISNLSEAGSPSDLFAFKINYNNVENDLNAPLVSKLYNGNISETYWITASDNIIRKYAYQYDDLNRLTFASYRLPNNVVPYVASFDEQINYDEGGNIISLIRNGDVEGLFPVNEIDNLTYFYELNSNKLLKVTEGTPAAISGFKDGTNTDNDYSYDDYGNLEIDNNKGITNIKYNHLNLPTIITFGQIGYIEYIYNADGVKLEKKVTQGNTTNNTKYLNGFQYLNNVLQFFPHSEGYVAKIGNSYKYVFQYKDHLGNVRLSYSQNSTTNNLDIIEESHYYPFGLKHSGYNSDTNLLNGNIDAQKYKFQGQERQDELSLNWDSFKWRNYDPTIGRFMSIDPLAEKYNWMTCYQFASNQVIHGREIEGLENYNDLTYDDLDDDELNFYGLYKVYGTNLFDKENNQIHTPNIDFEEVIVSGSKTRNYNNDEEYDIYTGFENEDFHVGEYDQNKNTKRDYSPQIGLFSTFLGALNDRATTNAQKVYNYGTKSLSAKDLTSQNASRMTSIAKNAKYLGQSFGVLGSAITAINGASDADGFTAGDGVELAIGLITTFTPYGWVYGLVDFGTKLATGTSITERIGDYVNEN